MFSLIALVEHVADEQGVAVGRGLRRGLERDIAVRARAVLDDEALAERLGELRRDDPRDDVRRAAGRVGHEHPHRAAGVGFLRRSREHGREQQGRGEALYYHFLLQGFARAHHTR
jgi:hypothetical protein